MSVDLMCTRSRTIHTANKVVHVLGHQIALSWQIQICYSQSFSGGPSLLSSLDTAPVSFSFRTLGRCRLVVLEDFTTGGLSGEDTEPAGESVWMVVLLGKYRVTFYTRIHAFMQGLGFSNSLVHIGIWRCNRLISWLFLVSIFHQFGQN